MLIAIASLLYELAGIQLPTPYCLPGLSLSLHHEQHLERVVDVMGGGGVKVSTKWRKYSRTCVNKHVLV